MKMTSKEACPKKHLHTRCPEGYLHWHEWAEKKSQEHYQVECPGCGFWVIWKRKPWDWQDAFRTDDGQRVS